MSATRVEEQVPRAKGLTRDGTGVCGYIAMYESDVVKVDETTTFSSGGGG